MVYLAYANASACISACRFAFVVGCSSCAAWAAQELHPTTKANLQAAMHAEAFAYAKYTLFAEAAASSGHPDVAALFGRTAGVELRDHFTAESQLLGFVGSNLANLQVGISGESQDLTDYARWAQEATTDGCGAAAVRGGLLSPAGVVG